MLKVLIFLSSKEGGEALERVSSVVIECGGKNLECDNKTEGAHREGMCNDDEAIKWMCQFRNFCDHFIEDQGGLSNRLGSARSAQLSSARLGSARLRSARLGSAWLGLAQLSSAWLG